MSEFSGKVAIVTGSSSGIGEVIAVMMSSRGASVTLCGRNQERLDAALDKCLNANGQQKDRLLALAGDLTDREYRKSIVKDTVDKFGKLDILVANAGLSFKDQEIHKATEDTYDSIMNTNLKSVFFLIQNALPVLEKSKGCVVCTSSLGSTMPLEFLTIYVMGKAALDHMTRCLALSLGPKGVRINNVNPGFVKTRAVRDLGDVDKANDMVAASENAKHPLGGRSGTAEEIAEVALFLASEKSSFVTGQCIIVDGGRTLVH